MSKNSKRGRVLPCLSRAGVAALLLVCGAWSVGQTPAPSSGDALEQGFRNPPDSARPRVWWHWMNGNITKEGIKADLEWMKRVGIGGFQNFDAGLTTPQVVPRRLTYMTPEWKDAFHYTAQLAQSMNLEMAIAGSPGWSESGGPWVPAKDGMKKYVWSEVRVKGGQPFRGRLPKPPSNTGAFQNVPVMDFGASMGGQSFKPPEYYEDVATIAYKLPDADVALADLHPKVTSSGGTFDLAKLTDGDLATMQLLPSTRDGKPGWVQFEFERPQTVKAVTVAGGGVDPLAALGGAVQETRSLEASEDGQTFRRLAGIPATVFGQVTIAVPATTARFFRVTFNNPPPTMDLSALFGSEGGPPPTPKGNDIGEIVLHTASKVNRFEEKAAFSTTAVDDTFATPPAGDATAQPDVVDLTGQVGADGTLSWDVPPGSWKIVRFGYSLLGITNHPASPEATGLEVDKLDPVAVKAYFTNYLDQYKDATGGLMGKAGLAYMVTDSWEAGAQNWTKSLPQEFQKRRGYSMTPYLPVLTGAVVKSAEASDRFLWDFRKTLEELVAEHHYDALTGILAQYGMKRYSESHESGRAIIADGMDVKRKAAVPMSAIWTPNPFINQNDQTGHTIDIRESASVAHVWGQNIVAAESLTALGFPTGAWSYSPETLKPTADLALASGLNRFVIHTSVHQPVDDKIPGLGLGPFGQWFTRHETWAEQAKAWVAYLARSSYMLQQGRAVADVAYYYGEDNNVTNLFAKKPPAIPEGYNYDFVNATALRDELSVKDGRLVTPSGMSYRVLVLDANARSMSLPVLRKLAELVRAGATVAGVKPERTPSLSDDPAEFAALVKEVWGSSKTKVSAGEPLERVLQASSVSPDYSCSKPQADTRTLFVHRTLPDGEVYWVDNRNDRVEDIEASFRVTGRAPELWHPETGEIEPAGYRIADGRTSMTLHLDPSEAVFVVFRKQTSAPSLSVPRRTESAVGTLDGPWDVSFQAGRGAPAKVTLDKLASWSENADPGVKYFSGTGTYARTVDAPAAWFAGGARVWLDLGSVKNLAEVVVNGQSLGVVWKKPFRVDVTGALKPGTNSVEIKVTDLWVNRLIGDQQPGAATKLTYTTMPFYKADSPLLPAGLLGPVRLVRVTTATP
jgi:hypothetical protein